MACRGTCTQHQLPDCLSLQLDTDLCLVQVCIPGLEKRAPVFLPLSSVEQTTPSEAAAAVPPSKAVVDTCLCCVLLSGWAVWRSGAYHRSPTLLQ